MIVPEYKILVDKELCINCRRCVFECSFGAHVYDEKKKKIVRLHEKCVGCFRCVATCPTKAIEIIRNPMLFDRHHTWKARYIRDIKIQANSGSVILTATGTDYDYPSIFDRLLIDACQVTNPPIDPLREPMETRVYIGRKPDVIDVDFNGEKVKLKTKIGPYIVAETPIMIAHMSYGALSLEAHKALAMAAKECGTYMGTGEGGLHKSLYPYADHIIVQVASGRFGVTEEYLKVGAAIEIKIGQGAKPGIGGHLPGSKVTKEISETRMIPEGTDALSPAPHHDIYSIEDLARLIAALKEATRYKKPVFVKIAAVHNVAAIAVGIANAGADAIVIDGLRGGTGATPQIMRDHVGIPIEFAIASVDRRLRQEKIRNQVSIIASGGIRCAADVVKAIALGADAVYIGTAALIALGCTVCKRCYTGKCAWGIATQDPRLRKRLNPEEGARRVANLIKAWTHEIKEVMGALGINSIESLRGNRDRLRAVGLTDAELRVLGVKVAGD